jgi:adenylosuccinate lyase
METRDIYANLSPLDHRYWSANKELFDSLSERLSEAASICYCARAEVALARAHLRLRGLESAALAAELDALEARINPEEVYAEEEKTQHNIRALVNVMKAKVSPAIAPFIHMGATSVDILDTAKSLKLRAAFREVLLPLLVDVERILCGLAEREAETPQVGRTHGQHAVPISFGFAMAEYAARLGKSIGRLDALSKDLRGKLSGATGSYNALSMSYADPAEAERLYLSFLGLEPGDIATQLVEPEYALRLLLEANVAFGIIANLADDLRNLQRSEIGEVRESFGAEQVGSSTMPQKRNPWNSEHVKSLWKAFAPRVMSFYMDQISEHQRDLTNSASERFVADYLAGFAAAFNRMRKVLKGLKVDKERMAANLGMSGGAVLAEPAYILLSEAGRADAHEIVRKITLAAEAEGLAFSEALARSDAWPEVAAALARLGVAEPEAFFSHPERYRGRAAEKAREVAAKFASMMDTISSGLEARAN